MDTLEARKAKLCEQLLRIKDKDERLSFIVEQGKGLGTLPESLKLEAFLVKGCISRAWLVPQIQGERLSFLADSEAVLVKGILALILQVYNGSTAEEILELSPEFLAEAGVTELLSMNRRNGLVNVVGLVRQYAERLKQSASPQP